MVSSISHNFFHLFPTIRQNQVKVCQNELLVAPWARNHTKSIKNQTNKVLKLRLIDFVEI